MSEAWAFAKAVESALRGRRLTDAFHEIVVAYYEEYTDATELDPGFEAALSTIFEVCFPCGETHDGLEFSDLVKRKGNL
jgi:hypothetical protein